MHASGEALPERPISRAQASLIRKLRRRKERESAGLTVAEGVRCAGEALRAGRGVRLAVVSPRLGHVPGGPAFAERLARSGVKSVHATDRALADLSDTAMHQGVILVCIRGVRALDELPESPRIVVLDGIQDPGNVGTLVRSAHAFGLDGVVALGGTADPWSPKAVRASAGSVFHVPIVGAGAPALVDWATRRGVGLKVAEADASPASMSEGAREGVQGRSARSNWALVIGNEGVGVSDVVRRAAGETVGIAMHGAESLNAGVAGSILMYEYTKKGEVP